jgi:hypothetical protein
MGLVAGIKISLFLGTFQNCRLTIEFVQGFFHLKMFFLDIVLGAVFATWTSISGSLKICIADSTSAVQARLPDGGRFGEIT